jgi:hypothetical protein
VNEELEQVQAATRTATNLIWLEAIGPDPSEGLDRLGWLESLLADVEAGSLEEDPDAIHEAICECREMVRLLRDAERKARGEHE